MDANLLAKFDPNAQRLAQSTAQIAYLDRLLAKCAVLLETPRPADDSAAIRSLMEDK